MRVFRIFPPLPIALLLVAGAGMALNYTWLESREFWLQVLVGVVAMAASFVAGLLSPRLVNLFVVLIIVLGSISVAFAIYGVSNTHVEPVWFAIMLSMIYGTLGYAVWGAGWVVRGCLAGTEASRNGDL